MGWTTVAGLTGFLAVALGAFGAHALRQRLSPDLLAIFQTGVLYHTVHAVVLTALALYARATQSSVTLPSSLLVAGIALFSGSLYLLAITGQRWLGAITPLGGLCFLGAWLAIAFRLGK
jgi:uncharacterized membrane protein YgdD (TMEM256/DUF423 family)